MKDLEKLRIYYKDQEDLQDGDFDVYLLRSIKKGAPDNQDIVLINPKIRELIKSTKVKIQHEINKLNEPELQKALIAEITDEFLQESKKRDNHDRKQEIQLEDKERLA